MRLLLVGEILVCQFVISLVLCVANEAVGAEVQATTSDKKHLMCR